MKLRKQICSAVIGALAVAGYAHAGSDNTALGSSALASDSSGSYDTALGAFALSANTTANGNTAIGYVSLYTNSTGYANTATGSGSLQSNTTGYENTATGNNALHNNSTGHNNSALGYMALSSNIGTSENTAVGSVALAANNIGDDNTAVGASALSGNTEGYANTSTGALSMVGSTTGSNNTAVGYQTLYLNGSAGNNTAIGSQALYQNTGSDNIGVGYQSGMNLSAGNNNIEIGNVGADGESNTIRIGTPSTQTATYVAGIYGTTLSGTAVVVNSKGQLGVVMSSERFKTDIEPMGETSARLRQLRPVTFHYKSDPHGNLQYGLIAEEVAKVYPDLVVRNSSGRIDSVRYDELAPLLLNELQREQKALEAQTAQLHDLQMQLTELKDVELPRLKAAKAMVSASEGLVAQR
jgi:Chaperone of endosialidase